MTRNPAVVIEELKRITAEHGGVLNAEDVVSAAEPPDSPLHSWFGASWDDSVAAHQWRLHLARRLIAVSVTYLQHGEERLQSRVFVSTDRGKGGEGYRLMVDVMTDSDRRRQLLKDALADLTAFRKKYAELQELAKVFEEIAKLYEAVVVRATLAYRAVISERDGWRLAYNNATTAKNRLSAENRRLRRMLIGLMAGAAVEITGLVAGLIWFAMR